MTKRIGILTAGGDAPGLNAAIRGLGKAAIRDHGMELVGFKDGLMGLIKDSWIDLDSQSLAGVLTVGGTILGTSRVKPHKMMVDGEPRDMIPTIVQTYERHGLDGLVMLGGGGTAKNALRLHKAGLNVITLPKTIDNDIARTDSTFGFATALEIATDAIDRLHSTAHSHHRIILTEIMGHRAGWLALGAGIAGGADVILIPEIPYELDAIVSTIETRRSHGHHFSVIAIAEGAMSREDSTRLADAQQLVDGAGNASARAAAKEYRTRVLDEHRENPLRLARALEEATSLEARVTILGYIQRGGTPCSVDRLLATRLGTTGADLVADGQYGVMVAARGEGAEPVPLTEVAGTVKLVPEDHPWLRSARQVGTCMGD